jgi:hypothetical protein
MNRKSKIILITHYTPLSRKNSIMKNEDFAFPEKDLSV